MELKDGSCFLSLETDWGSAACSLSQGQRSSSGRVAFAPVFQNAGNRLSQLNEDRNFQLRDMEGALG